MKTETKKAAIIKLSLAQDEERVVIFAKGTITPVDPLLLDPLFDLSRFQQEEEKEEEEEEET
jgi:hypothetical protein